MKKHIYFKFVILSCMQIFFLYFKNFKRNEQMVIKINNNCRKKKSYLRHFYFSQLIEQILETGKRQRVKETTTLPKSRKSFSLNIFLCSTCMFVCIFTVLLWSLYGRYSVVPGVCLHPRHFVYGGQLAVILVLLIFCCSCLLHLCHSLIIVFL